MKRYKTEVVADNMIMLDRKGGESFGGAEPSYSGGIKKSSSSDAGVPVGMAEGGDVTIDDLPF